MNRVLLKVGAASLFALPIAALAHPGHGGQGFAAGLAHPFLGLDHLLALLAIGLYCALRGRGRWLAPLLTLACVALGALLGSSGFAPARIEPLLAASVLVPGLMLWRPRANAGVPALVLIALFALAHGIAHGSELAASAPALAGIVLASALLLASGMALADFLLRARPWLLPAAGRALACVGGGLVVAALI